MKKFDKHERKAPLINLDQRYSLEYSKDGFADRKIIHDRLYYDILGNITPTKYKNDTDFLNDWIDEHKDFTVDHAYTGLIYEKPFAVTGRKSTMDNPYVDIMDSS
jgi:hypothetical protein